MIGCQCHRWSGPILFKGCPVLLVPMCDVVVQVVCFPQFCSKDNPAKHPPVTAGKYLLGKYSNTHQDFDGNQQEHKTT